MSEQSFSRPLRVSQLNPRQPTAVDLSPDAAARARIAADLGLSSLPSARLVGRIAAASSDAWQLDGRLTARVEQPCAVSLVPVFTDIDEPVRRLYSPHAATPEGEEIEMLDDEIEPLGQVIDPGAVLLEALALALPAYPRAKGAALPDDATGAGGDDAGTRRPFAGLADLIGSKDGRPPN